MRRKGKQGILLITVLVFAFLFCACKKNTTEENQNSTATNQNPACESAASVDKKNLSNDSVVISVGKTQVKASELYAYLYMLKNKYELSLGHDIWAQKVEDGKSVELASMQEIVHMITEMKIIQKQAANQNVTLTVDENEEVDARVKAFIQTVPAETLNQYGITEEVVKTIFSDNEMARKMFDIVTGTVNDSINTEDVRQIKIQYMRFIKNGTDANGNAIALNDQQKTELLQKADKIRKNVIKKGDFFSIASENSGDKQVEITIGKDAQPAEMAQAAFALKTGEYSPIVETADSFYLIYCVSDNEEAATTQKKEAIIVQKQNELFQKEYENWMNSSEVRISDMVWSDVHF